jgi:hypothetical protein
VFLIVAGQCGTGERDIGDIGIKRRSLHRASRQRVIRSANYAVESLAQ